MKKALAVFSILVISAAPAFPADSYTIDPDYSAANFEIARVGFSTQFGRFNRTSGKVSLDFAAKQGSVEFTIYTASIDMGSAAWTSHLSDPGLFNVKKYPTMNFKSDKLIFDGNKVVGAEGKFTMLGVTNPLTVEVNRFECGVSPVNKKTMCSGNITAKLNRSDYGLVKYIPAVSDEVKINVPVDAYKN